jgi:hypothetical protein
MPRRKPLVTPPDSEHGGRLPTGRGMRSPGPKPSTPAAMPGKLTEERLDEERPGDVVVPLKNGVGRIAIGDARYAQEELRLLMTSAEVDGPGLVTALHALAEGRRDAVSREQREILQKRQFIDRAGELRPRIKAVVLAGYRQTPAGPVITEPLDLSNPEHEAAARRDAEEQEARVNRRSGRFRIWLADQEVRERRKGEDQGRSS